ncbi:MAG: PorP/SprF family type IX secretion system membrane protein [Bacteroidetes bacterium]|nr:PorP/SprF family type IX secretion system membrane protein [Fibrella sp.]
MSINYSLRLLAFCLFLLSVTVAFGQKEMMYSQYMLNPLAINPAYAGSRESLNFALMFRRKWFGAQNSSLATGGGGGGPISQTFSGDGAIANGKIGLGIQAQNDQLSTFGTTGVYGSVAYRIDLPALAKLSIGVQGGVNVLPVFDQFSGGFSVRQAVGSAGVGVYYQSPTFFGGISLPELVNKGVVLSGQALFNATLPLFIQAGTKLNLADELVLIPSVLITRAANRPLGVDLNARLWLKEKLGLGVSLRANSLGVESKDYVQALAEYQLSSAIRVGYAFSSQTIENPLFPQRSAHELTFKYALNNLTFNY